MNIQITKFYDDERDFPHSWSNEHTNPQEQESKSAEEILVKDIVRIMIDSEFRHDDGSNKIYVGHISRTQYHNVADKIQEAYRNQPLPAAPEIDAGKILYPLELQTLVFDYVAWLKSMIPHVNKSLRPQIIQKIKELGEYKFAALPALPTREYLLQIMMDWHQRYYDEKKFNIPLDHEQSEYLSWLAFELAGKLSAPALPVQQVYSVEHLRTEFENNPPFEFAAENYWEVYAEWLEGKYSGDGWISVDTPPDERYAVCLVFNANDEEYKQRTIIAPYFEQNKKFTTDRDYIITHWRYLPLPPKTK